MDGDEIAVPGKMRPWRTLGTGRPGGKPSEEEGRVRGLGSGQEIQEGKEGELAWWPGDLCRSYPGADPSVFNRRVRAKLKAVSPQPRLCERGRGRGSANCRDMGS